MSACPATASATEVEFGLFDWIDTRLGAEVSTVYDDRLRLLAEADRGGFSVYHLAEHHGTPLGLAPSPGVFTAAAARETRRIRLAPTTFVVPLYDPLRLVQELAMLDQLSHGRLEIGVGKGSSPLEAAMYGLTPDEAAARFARDLPAILEALETGVFRRPDGHGGVGEPIPLHVPAYQHPHPPLWYPTSNPDSIPRLGEQGYHVLFGFGFASPPLDVVRTQSEIFFARYRAAAAAGTAPATTPRFGVMRHVLVAPSDDEALALARPAFHAHHDSFGHLWRRSGSDRFSGPIDLDELIAAGKVYVGSPDTVAGRIAEAVTAGGVTYVAGAFAWGSLPVETSLRSLRLFRDEVVPAVRAARSAGAPSTAHAG